MSENDKKLAKKANSFISILEKEFEENNDYRPSPTAYLPVLSTEGKQSFLDVHSILLVGDLGHTLSIIVFREGTVLYTRTPYMDILAMLDEIASAVDSYDLQYVVRGVMPISGTEERETFSGEYRYGKLAGHAKGNQETH